AAVAFLRPGVGPRDIEGPADPGVIQEANGPLPVPVETLERCGLLQGAALLIDRAEQRHAVAEPGRRQLLRQAQVRRLEKEVIPFRAPVEMAEAVGGPGTVGILVERSRLDEPGVSVGPEDAGELAGDHATGLMNQPLRKNDGGGKVVAGAR